MYVNVRAIIERQTDNGVEILIQQRIKPNEIGIPYELPGGRLEEFESFLSGLKREVKEETGLDIISISGAETKIETKEINTNVEVLQPFAVYQTLKGPVDSMGIYFRCRAEGNLLQEGDETKNIKWISIQELENAIRKNLIDVSWVDKSGILYYLDWIKE
jgi:8-oxo-dGTP diphosphatase